MRDYKKTLQGQAQAELSGAGMYFTLARIAKAHGLEDVSMQFTELANQHADQASFYFTASPTATRKRHMLYGSLLKAFPKPKNTARKPYWI